MSITPQKNSIMQIFSINKQYYLDFYQRDYQWKKPHVDKLLEDLFYRFELDYKTDLDVTPEAVSRFDWYYLNAYVTNDFQGKTFIVDGQQRLTTLTLILIKLYHLAKSFQSERSDVVKEQIMGAGLMGPTFWMGHGDRQDVFKDLFNNGQATREISGDDVSVRNLYESYKIIERTLDLKLTTLHKLDTFIFYFLTRIELVNIQIQDTKDVPMVFEVINDRGERLKPYEVLKGKLLGQIDKTELDHYYDIWQTHIHALQSIGENEVDEFFRFYFRSKYVDNRTEWREFDGEYHKAIYEDKWNEKIQLKQNALGVKKFITEELDYYGSLYLRIRNEALSQKEESYLYFNDLNEQDRQYVMVLSACKVDDPDENEKIQLVAKMIDKHFTLLQLTGAYDSNKFTESIIELNKNIRDKPLDEIKTVFEQQILDDIAQAKQAKVSSPFEWAYFSNASKQNLPDRFLKYSFARIDHFIAKELGIPCETYNELVRRTGPMNGFHIEHILANNETNLGLFDNDDELFNVERNKLGAILLLQGRDNMASQNEPYLGKRKIYATRSILWNRTLSPDFYHNHPGIKDVMRKFHLQFKPYDAFDKSALQERQRLLFELTKLIWA
jgi:uncharacterized protein with ParB-like and HNH nuclease domain